MTWKLAATVADRLENIGYHDICGTKSEQWEIWGTESWAINDE